MNKNLRHLLTLLTGVFIAAYTAYHIQSAYPLVGWDHKYFFTRLIDTHLHYRINGFTVQWYTPSFGGGLPGFPHPLNAQYSLPQILALFLEPWAALLSAYFVYSLAGFLAAYRLLRRVPQWGWMPATLGTALFSANGFNLNHLANGHFNFQAFPLLPLFLLALLDPSLPLRAAVALLALTFGIFIYSASTYPLAFAGLSLLISLPLLHLLRPGSVPLVRLLKIGILGGLLALALSAAKLHAVASLMRFFPRAVADVFDIPLRLAPLGLLNQLIGTMGFAPYLALTGQKMNNLRQILQTSTGAYVGYWELDLSLSPVIWILLLGGFFTLANRLLRRRLSLLSPAMLPALALLGAAIWLTLEFTFGRGLFYPTLRNLPFLNALHVNPRFGSALLFPLALLAAATLQTWGECLTKRQALTLFLLFNLLTLFSLTAYQLLPLDKMQARTFDIRSLQEVYQNIEQGETYPITQILDINDQRVFDDHASNLKPYEVLFGYNQQHLRAQVQPGDPRRLANGYYNMTNPASLVFPEANQTTPWSLIPQEQSTQLEDFLARRQPTWEISPAQAVANGASLVALVVSLFLLLPFPRQKQTSR